MALGVSKECSKKLKDGYRYDLFDEYSVCAMGVDGLVEDVVSFFQAALAWCDTNHTSVGRRSTLKWM